MKDTMKKIAALTLTLVFAFGINVGLNSVMESDTFDFLFSSGSNTTIDQSQSLASGNTMLPSAPDPRDRAKEKEEKAKQE
jgi:hypothetical protein